MSAKIRISAVIKPSPAARAACARSGRLGRNNHYAEATTRRQQGAQAPTVSPPRHCSSLSPGPGRRSGSADSGPTADACPTVGRSRVRLPPSQQRWQPEPRMRPGVGHALQCNPSAAIRGTTTTTSSLSTSTAASDACPTGTQCWSDRDCR